MPPNLASLIMSLPIELSDNIWSQYCGSYNIRPRALIPCDRLDPLFGYQNIDHCVICAQLRYEMAEDCIPLLIIDKATSADFQRYLYSLLQKISFCNADCLREYLSVAERWGVLQWAQTITFQVAPCYRRIDYEWIMEDVILKLEELKERMQRMHPEEDASVEWKVDMLRECLDEIREEGWWEAILTKRT